MLEIPVKPLLMLLLLLSCTKDDETETDVTDDTGLATVGEPCAAAVDCEPGLICPYVSTTERECVDPLDGVYDDGSRPEVEAAGTWFRKRVGDWEAESLVCNDGSPYAYYISPGVGEAADSWLLFLKGGGDCYDDESCAARWPQSTQFMRQVRTAWSDTWSPGDGSGVEDGIFARDQETNHFRSWTHVYLHYCSSDVFSGTSGADDNELRLHFRGRPTTEAVVDELMEGVDLSAASGPALTMDGADEVVLAGGSAGSVGARHLMDWVATRVHADSPSTRVRGFADSVWVPPARPGRYKTTSPRFDLWEQVLDADCVAAHPETHPGLCDDAYHLLHGGGTAGYFGEEDEGHLGVALAGESAVDGLFIFQSQTDLTTFMPMGMFGWCVASDDCSDDDDCEPGQGCLGGVCYDVQPCTPMYCTPDDEPCHDVGEAPTCIGEVVAHENVCGFDEDCAAGEQCLLGYCVQQGYTGCETTDECPEGFACTNWRCGAGISESECDDIEGYTFDGDTRMCLQVIGCTDANPCGEGYGCMAETRNPVGQALIWGVREELSGLGPSVGVYATSGSTHTATIGEKYYGRKLAPVDGHTHAEVVDAWMSGSPDYYDHISLPAEVPTLLWADQVTGLEAGSAEAHTTGTGCDRDAFGFLLCEVDAACTGPEDALYAVGIGDDGPASVAGTPPSEAVQLQLTIRANDTCTDPELEVPDGAWLDLSYRVPTTGAGNTVRVALPATTLTSELLPVTLYVGADGATWSDRELTTLAAGRLD